MAQGSIAGWPGRWRWLHAGQPAWVGRAPGRLDVMGGIADYSGATVLELPLACCVVVAMQQSDDSLLHVCSEGPGAPHLDAATLSIPAGALDEGPPGAAPARLRHALDQAGAGWAAYILGPLALLRAGGYLDRLGGLRVAVWSDVPSGAGVSSSAALEMASLQAAQGLLGLALEPLQAAFLAQQAEHQVALSPCGIMDQVTAVLGRADHLLMLRCQPAEVLGYQRLPRDVQVLGIDSGVAHRVAGAQYGRVRTATFMGRAIIQSQQSGDPAGGYLCNLSPQRFAARYEQMLPETISGAAFLEAHGQTGDDATTIDPEAGYRPRDCTAHPIHEQANVAAFLDALVAYERHGDRAALVEAGAAMYRSHRSYGERCGLGTAETDLIVELVRQRGAEAGLYGAKITGGGAGGTVAILAAGDGASAAVAAVAAEYTRRSGQVARVIAGSSDGATAWPPRQVRFGATGEINEA